MSLWCVCVLQGGDLVPLVNMSAVADESPEESDESDDLLSRSVYVPIGRVWLEGDNASQSFDSRNYGPIPQALLVGRVTYKVWPSFQRIE